MKKLLKLILFCVLFASFSVSAHAYDSQNTALVIDTYIVLGLIIGFIAALITVVVIIVKYKTKLKAPIYPLSDFASLTLKSKSDVFLGKHVSRVRINTSSNTKR